jgi:hypothetical protein
MFDGHSDTDKIEDVVSENEENFNVRIEEMFDGYTESESMKKIEELFDWNTEIEMIEEEGMNVMSEYEYDRGIRMVEGNERISKIDLS